MARRSPTNPRYQRGAKVGSTRRSASAAKPKRQVGDSAGTPKAKANEPSRSLLAPRSAEERKWRRLWWVFMGVALVCVVLAFTPLARENAGVMRILLAVELGAIAGAITLDFTKIRKARREAMEAAKEDGRSAGRR